MAAIDINPQQSASIVYVFPFGKGISLPSPDRNLLGGKGQNLIKMASIGLPVPPGFIITTETCLHFLRKGKHLPEKLEEQIQAAIKILENLIGAQFGGDTNPLMVSVRSGAPVSMPGMMDTILDLGLNDRTVVAFAKTTNNERLAYDCYRRFISMYSCIVHGMSRDLFASELEALKKSKGVERDTELDVTALKQLCQRYQELFNHKMGHQFPQDTYQQLIEAIRAVFSSWESERATLYRHVNHIPDNLGTGVTVEAMVFGNRNDRSATGVAFTRNPSTGENIFYGEFLPNAQGEDVVAGTRTPHPINEHQKSITGSTKASLEEMMPDVYEELRGVVGVLEKHYRDMQDIEFTIDDGHLYMLQTRTGKRTGFASARMAIEMLDEGLIDEVTALKRIEPEQLEQLLAPVFHPKDKEMARRVMVAKGINAGPGAASGVCALTSAKAQEYQLMNKPCILVRHETNPDDFAGIVAAEGILTARGGSTSHAAVVARGMGKPCICGCGELQIDLDRGTVTANGQTIKEGDSISIDGSSGEVFFCKLSTSPSEILQVLLTKEISPEASKVFQNYTRIMALADKYRKLKVRANADTCHDSVVARCFGSEGVGLCRTEHMFLEEQRLFDVRRMLFSTSREEREAATHQLLPSQREDFKRLFRSMNGMPVTIRLLDPPLHEFLMVAPEAIKDLAERLQIPLDKLKETANALREHNPMLGFRGCRLGILNPALTRMQARAIFEAAVEVTLEGCAIYLEIMIPLVAYEQEFIHQKMIVDAVAEEVFNARGLCINYSLGTMIELPRAALLADRIAKEACFFSFGTNDLTQTTLGMSRDDANHFLPLYIQGIPNPSAPNDKMYMIPNDPFQTIDQDGVGELMKIAVERGRKTRPGLKCGICGEHGGDPQTVMFCHRIGLDYVSCSPYRVPIARLAAARATLI